MRQAGDPAVLRWLDAQVIETLFLSTINVAELRFGIAVMAPGRRREALREDFEQRILPLFTGRILPFDLAAAGAYAELNARARAAGRALGAADGFIAAVAAAHGMAVATRDTAPFEAAGLRVFNPWTTGG